MPAHRKTNTWGLPHRISVACSNAAVILAVADLHGISKSGPLQWLPWLLQKESELGSGKQGAPAPWVWVGADAALIRGLFRALNGYCISEVPRGWTALERIACYLRCDAFPLEKGACTNKKVFAPIYTYTHMGQSEGRRAHGALDRGQLSERPGKVLKEQRICSACTCGGLSCSL